MFSIDLHVLSPAFIFSSLPRHLSPAPAFVRRFISCHLKLQRDVTTSALALTCEFSSAGLVNNKTRSKCSRTPKTQIQQLKNSVRFCIDKKSGQRSIKTFIQYHLIREEADPSAQLVTGRKKIVKF